LSAAVLRRFFDDIASRLVCGQNRPLTSRIRLDGRIRNMRTEKRVLQLPQEVNTKVLTFLILLFVSAAFSEDFKILNGKEFKDATITRVEPDGIVVKTKSGTSKIYFGELPKEVQVPNLHCVNPSFPRRKT
jgi:hypothetical protein